FVEAIEMNLSLIRKRLSSPQLKAVKLNVGEVAKTIVYVLYIEGIANTDIVNEMINRIQDIEIDGVIDGNILVQYIDDNPNSIFPQFLTTQRPDVITSKVLVGKVCCIVDGSPTVISAPTNFFEFFT